MVVSCPHFRGWPHAHAHTKALTRLSRFYQERDMGGRHGRRAWEGLDRRTDG